MRVTARGERERVAHDLGGAARRAFAPTGVTDATLDPSRGAAFDRGEYVIQDEASQLVPLLLGAEPNDTVVDCCAAPGTKAVQLAEQVGPRGEVIALELHRTRIALIHKSARAGSGSRTCARSSATSRRASTCRAARSTAACWSTRRARASARCAAIPTRAGACAPRRSARCAERALAILASAARYVEEGGVARL